MKKRKRSKKTKVTKEKRKVSTMSVRKESERMASRVVDLLDDAYVVSLGLVSVSADKLGDFSKDAPSLSKYRSEGTKMRKKVCDRRDKMYDVVKEQTGKALEVLNIATQDDLKDLERRVGRRRSSKKAA